MKYQLVILIAVLSLLPSGVIGSTVVNIDGTYNDREPDNFVAKPQSSSSPCYISVEPIVYAPYTAQKRSQSVVTSRSDCRWKVDVMELDGAIWKKKATWIKITAVYRNGFNYVLSENTSTTTRKGRIIVGGETVTILQYGIPCTLKQ